MHGQQVSWLLEEKSERNIRRENARSVSIRMLFLPYVTFSVFTHFLSSQW